MGKYILIGLSVILPIAALYLIPWAITFAKPEWRDSSFGTIWTLSLTGLLLAFVLFILIYGRKQDITKTPLWLKIFGK